jgi:hypothetical protein
MEELDVAGNFVSSTTQCALCGREIGFKDNKPYDAKYVSDGVYKLLPSLHFETCPVRIKRRMESNCAWCQFERGVSILKLHHLFQYEKCDRHSDASDEFSYLGKTYKRTNDALRAIFHDAVVMKRRRERKSRKPDGVAEIGAFLKENMDGDE